MKRPSDSISLAWFTETLRAHLPEQISISPEQIDALYAHFERLLLWNDRMSLTAIRSHKELVRLHYCESLWFASLIPPSWPSGTAADIGSGPGFPGIGVATLKPACTVTLIESHQRKAVFLTESTRSFPNIRVAAKRAESIDLTYDFLLSRAVTPRDVFDLLPRLSSSLGLLVGDHDREDLLRRLGFTWNNHQNPYRPRSWAVFGQICST